MTLSAVAALSAIATGTAPQRASIRVAQEETLAGCRLRDLPSLELAVLPETLHLNGVASGKLHSLALPEVSAAKAERHHLAICRFNSQPVTVDRGDGGGHRHPIFWGDLHLAGATGALAAVA